MYDFSRSATMDQNKPHDNSSSSSSSIGKNSDDLPFTNDNQIEAIDNGKDDEVQSKFNMEDLEEALNLKKGLSVFYSGKEKTFTNLNDLQSCSSINEIAKPAKHFSKRRNHLVSLKEDRNKHYLRLHGGGISKRVINSKSLTLKLGTKEHLEKPNNGDETSNPIALPQEPRDFNEDEMEASSNNNEVKKLG